MKLITDFNKLDDYDYLILLENKIFEALKIDNIHIQLIELNNIQSIITSHLYYNYQGVELQKLIYDISTATQDFALNLEKELFGKYNGALLTPLMAEFQDSIERLHSKQDNQKIKLRIKLIEKLTLKINEIKNDIINPSTDEKLTELAGKYIFNNNINILCRMLFQVNYPVYFDVKKPIIFEKPSTFIKATYQNYLVMKNGIPKSFSANSVRRYFDEINNDKERYKTDLVTDSRLYKDLETSLKTISKKYLVK